MSDVGLAAAVIGLVLSFSFILLLLPRIFGRLLSVIYNLSAKRSQKSTGTPSHLRLASVHLFPLAGKVLLRSLRWTSEEMTVGCEELALTFRWWRYRQKACLGSTCAAPTVLDQDNFTQFDGHFAPQQFGNNTRFDILAYGLDVKLTNSSALIQKPDEVVGAVRKRLAEDLGNDPLAMESYLTQIMAETWFHAYSVVLIAGDQHDDALMRAVADRCEFKYQRITPPSADDNLRCMYMLKAAGLKISALKLNLEDFESVDQGYWHSEAEAASADLIGWLPRGRLRRVVKRWRYPKAEPGEMKIVTAATSHICYVWDEPNLSLPKRLTSTNSPCSALLTTFHQAVVACNPDGVHILQKVFKRLRPSMTDSWNTVDTSPVRTAITFQIRVIITGHHGIPLVYIPFSLRQETWTNSPLTQDQIELPNSNFSILSPEAIFIAASIPLLAEATSGCMSSFQVVSNEASVEFDGLLPMTFLRSDRFLFQVEIDQPMQSNDPSTCNLTLETETSFVLLPRDAISLLLDLASHCSAQSGSPSDPRFFCPTTYNFNLSFENFCLRFGVEETNTWTSLSNRRDQDTDWLLEAKGSSLNFELTLPSSPEFLALQSFLVWTVTAPGSCIQAVIPFPGRLRRIPTPFKIIQFNEKFNLKAQHTWCQEKNSLFDANCNEFTWDLSEWIVQLSSRHVALLANFVRNYLGIYQHLRFNDYERGLCPARTESHRNIASPFSSKFSFRSESVRLAFFPGVSPNWPAEDELMEAVPVMILLKANDLFFQSTSTEKSTMREFGTFEPVRISAVRGTIFNDSYSAHPGTVTVSQVRGGGRALFQQNDEYLSKMSLCAGSISGDISSGLISCGMAFAEDLLRALAEDFLVPEPNDSWLNPLSQKNFQIELCDLRVILDSEVSARLLLSRGAEFQSDNFSSEFFFSRQLLQVPSIVLTALESGSWKEAELGQLSSSLLVKAEFQPQGWSRATSNDRRGYFDRFKNELASQRWYCTRPSSKTGQCASTSDLTRCQVTIGSIALESSFQIFDRLQGFLERSRQRTAFSAIQQQLSETWSFCNSQWHRPKSSLGNQKALYQILPSNVAITLREQEACSENIAVSLTLAGTAVCNPTGTVGRLMFSSIQVGTLLASLLSSRQCRLIFDQSRGGPVKIAGDLDLVAVVLDPTLIHEVFPQVTRLGSSLSSLVQEYSLGLTTSRCQMAICAAQLTGHSLFSLSNELNEEAGSAQLLSGSDRVSSGLWLEKCPDWCAIISAVANASDATTLNSDPRLAWEERTLCLINLQVNRAIVGAHRKRFGGFRNISHRSFPHPTAPTTLTIIEEGRLDIPFKMLKEILSVHVYAGRQTSTASVWKIRERDWIQFLEPVDWTDNSAEKSHKTGLKAFLSPLRQFTAALARWRPRKDKEKQETNTTMSSRSDEQTSPGTLRRSGWFGWFAKAETDSSVQHEPKLAQDLIEPSAGHTIASHNFSIALRDTADVILEVNHSVVSLLAQTTCLSVKDILGTLGSPNGEIEVAVWKLKASRVPQADFGDSVVINTAIFSSDFRAKNEYESLQLLESSNRMMSELQPQRSMKADDPHSSDVYKLQVQASVGLLSATLLTSCSVRYELTKVRVVSTRMLMTGMEEKKNYSGLFLEVEEHVLSAAADALAVPKTTLAVVRVGGVDDAQTFVTKEQPVVFRSCDFRYFVDACTKVNGALSRKEPEDTGSISNRRRHFGLRIPNLVLEYRSTNRQPVSLVFREVVVQLDDRGSIRQSARIQEGLFRDERGPLIALRRIQIDLLQLGSKLVVCSSVGDLKVEVSERSASAIQKFYSNFGNLSLAGSSEDTIALSAEGEVPRPDGLPNLFFRTRVVKCNVVIGQSERRSIMRLEDISVGLSSSVKDRSWGITFLCCAKSTCVLHQSRPVFTLGTSRIEGNMSRERVETKVCIGEWSLCLDSIPDLIGDIPNLSSQPYETETYSALLLQAKVDSGVLVFEDQRSGPIHFDVQPCSVTVASVGGNQLMDISMNEISFSLPARVLCKLSQQAFGESPETEDLDPPPSTRKRTLILRANVVNFEFEKYLHDSRMASAKINLKHGAVGVATLDSQGRKQTSSESLWGIVCRSLGVQVDVDLKGVNTILLEMKHIRCTHRAALNALSWLQFGRFDVGTDFKSLLILQSWWKSRKRGIGNDIAPSRKPEGSMMVVSFGLAKLQEEAIQLVADLTDPLGAVATTLRRAWIRLRQPADILFSMDRLDIRNRWEDLSQSLKIGNVHFLMHANQSSPQAVFALHNALGSLKRIKYEHVKLRLHKHLLVSVTSRPGRIAISLKLAVVEAQLAASSIPALKRLQSLLQRQVRESQHQVATLVVRETQRDSPALELSDGDQLLWERQPSSKARRSTSTGKISIEGSRVRFSLHGFSLQDKNYALFNFEKYLILYDQKQLRESLRGNLNVDLEKVEVSYFSNGLENKVGTCPSSEIVVNVLENGSAADLDLRASFSSFIEITTFYSSYQNVMNMLLTFTSLAYSDSSAAATEEEIRRKSQLGESAPKVKFSEITSKHNTPRVTVRELRFNPNVKLLGDLSGTPWNIPSGPFFERRKRNVAVGLYQYIMISLGTVLDHVPEPSRSKIKTTKPELAK